MNKVKRSLAVVASALVVAALACVYLMGCQGADGTKINVMALKGPTGIGMAHMASANTSGNSYQFAGDTDEVVSAISSGAVDVAAVPTNLASVLYNKTNGGVKMIDIDTYGSLYLVQNGEGIDDMADLKGKTVYATGKGANPQYVLEFLLGKAGLEVGKDVQVKYLSEHSELAAQVIAGKAQIALLPEPFVSTVTNKLSTARIAVDLNEAWEQATGSKLTMGCVIARTEFVEQHPKAIEGFISDLGVSIDTAIKDPKATAEVAVGLGIMADASIAESAIPNCKLCSISGADMQPAISDYFNVLCDANAKSIGGKVPGDDFYYIPAAS